VSTSIKLLFIARFCDGWCDSALATVPYQPWQCGNANCGQPRRPYNNISACYNLYVFVQNSRYASSECFLL